MVSLIYCVLCDIAYFILHEKRYIYIDILNPYNSLISTVIIIPQVKVKQSLTTLGITKQLIHGLTGI